MDSAIVGSLIGVGIMVCLGLSVACYDHGDNIKEHVKKKWKEFRKQKQPLLPTEQKNPLFIRSTSKQFQMKELLPKK